MMITNKHNQFFWNKIQKNWLFILLALQFSCAKTESLKIESLKTQNGWGYTISHKNKIVIKQTIIPVISDNKSFSSESDALKVGNLVVEKLSKNMSPTVTKNDLILLKIKI